MSRTRRLTDDIKGFLASDDQRLTPEVERWAAEYAAACRDANGRLRQCMDRIRVGLRAEAVHLAEQEPPLTDLVNELDLAEGQAAWDELCGMYDLPRAEALRLELAEAVGEAYAELEPLADLLGRHRKLALARAPLPARIAVVRQLAEADPLSTFWEDDVRAYERARLREVEPEARAAGQAGDTAALVALVAELTAPGWRETPPEETVRRVRGMGGQVQREAARRELAELEPPLQSAFAAMDLPAARALRDRWQATAAKAKLPADHPLSEAAAPALGWVADEEARESQDRAFRQAVAALETTVDRDNADMAALDRAAGAAARFDRELPAALVSRYRNRRVAVETGDKRRRMAIVAASATAVALVLGFVGLLLYREGVSRDVQRLAGEVRGLVTDGKLTEARRLFDDHRNVSATEAWLTTRRELESAEAAETARAADYAAAMQAALAAETAADAAGHLQTAAAKAKTPDERLAAADLKRNWADRRAADRLARERQFGEAALAARRAVARLDRFEPGADADGLLAAAEAAVAEAVRQAHGLPAATTVETGVLEARLRAVGTGMADGRDRETLLTGITGTFGQADGDPARFVAAYVAALEAYRKRFPADPRSEEFREATAEADLWTGVLAWDRLTRAWRSARPDAAGDIAPRRGAVAGYLAVHPTAPTAAVAREYETFLTAVSNRDAADGPRMALLDLFRAPLIAGPLYVLSDRSGKTYYLPQPADFTGNAFASVTYIHGLDTRRDRKTRGLKKDDLTRATTEPAPGVALAERVRAALPRVGPAEWDDYLRGLAGDVLQDDRLDPFLRHFLLGEVLTAAADGNPLLAGPLEEVRDRLADEDIDPATKWMDPDDEAAAAVRLRAAAALRRVSAADLDAAWRRAADAETALSAQLARVHRAAGWLCRDGGVWKCRTTAGPPGLALSVAIPPAEPKDQPAAWQPIGTGGTVASSGAALKQGRITFAVGAAVRTAGR